MVKKEAFVTKKHCDICNNLSLCKVQKKVTPTTHFLALLACAVLCLPCIPYMFCLEKEYICKKCFINNVND